MPSQQQLDLHQICDIKGANVATQYSPPNRFLLPHDVIYEHLKDRFDKIFISGLEVKMAAIGIGKKVLMTTLGLATGGGAGNVL